MRQNTWLRLLLVLAILMPLMLFFLLPDGPLMLGAAWFWLILILCFALIWGLLGRPAEPETGVALSAGPQMLLPQQQPPVVQEVMDVRLAAEQGGVQVFRGPLKEAPEEAFEKLKRQVGPAVVPLVQEDEQLGASVMLMPNRVERATLERRVFPWVNWLLFGLTVVTTTWAGAAHQGVNLLREPARFAVGLPYSLGLLAILGVHELGHYFTARYHRIHVTPPYFIPVPFALGTFGAFIQMKSPTEHRRALFDVAVAGPLAGLAVAIPALLIGLHYSQVISASADVAGQVLGTSAGSSLLFALLAKISLGQDLAYGHIVQLHPLAFAGWLGLIVTALNLLPIGQLDGGHMARAMFGTRAGATISRIAMWTLFLLALFVWPALFMWAIIVFFIAGRRGTPPLNDLTPITPARRWLGYATFLILALIITPLPHAFWSELGLHCPYL